MRPSACSALLNVSETLYGLGLATNWTLPIQSDLATIQRLHVFLVPVDLLIEPHWYQLSPTGEH